MRSRAEIVEQRLEQLHRLVRHEERAVEQVDPDDAERFGLRRVVVVEHAHVQDDLARLVARMSLELHAHPAVTFVRAPEALRGHGVGEREKRRRLAARFLQPLDVQLILVVEHRLEPRAVHVTLGVAVDRVTHRHVVGGDALGDRPGSRAGAKEPAHDLLSCPDLGERPVTTRIEVNGERFLAGCERAALGLGSHGKPHRARGYHAVVSPFSVVKQESHSFVFPASSEHMFGRVARAGQQCFRTSFDEPIRLTGRTTSPCRSVRCVGSVASVLTRAEWVGYEARHEPGIDWAHCRRLLARRGLRGSAVGLRTS